MLRRSVLPLLGVVLLAVPAGAQQPPLPAAAPQIPVTQGALTQSPPVPQTPTAPAPAIQAPSQAEVRITRQDCQRLVHHVPAADVAYRPGVDVHGKPVVAADLAGSGNSLGASMLPPVIEFPVTINPATWAGSRAANTQIAQGAAGQVAAYNSQQAAQTQVTTLAAQKTALSTQQTTLQSQAATLNTAKTTLAANLATLQAQVTAGTLSPYSPQLSAAQAAVTANQQQITANTQAQATTTQALSANATAGTQQQAAVTNATSQITASQMQQTAGQGALAKSSARGLDTTQMPVATVHFDLASNTVTINGQSVGSDNEQAIAVECRKRGLN